MRKIDVLGTIVCDLNLSGAVDSAMEMTRTRASDYIVTPNSEIVLAALNDDALRSALNAAALSLPDGTGVVAASRILGTPLKGRVTGVDLASALLYRLGNTGGSVFLLGGRDGIAELAAENIAKNYPGVVIAGCRGGYFTDEEENGIVEQINASSPDFLAVCLGSPKQEKWIARNSERLRVGVMAGLGGTIDVLAGVTRRAPGLWRALGLEWLFRLICEPWRYKRAARLPLILLKAAACRIGGKNGKRKADRP